MAAREYIVKSIKKAVKLKAVMQLPKLCFICGGSWRAGKA
jgi:hypothetical protein